MKKLLPILLCVLFLAGCGRIELPVVTQETQTELLSTEPVIVPPTAEEVRNAFDKALEVYGWFDLCSLETDSADRVEVGNATYCRVVREELPTLESLRTLVYSLFDTKTGEHLLGEKVQNKPYIDVDGALYGQDFARGTDMSKGEYTVEVTPESSTCMLCTVTVEIIDIDYNNGASDPKVIGTEDYTYHYQYDGNGRWVFTDFDLFY